MNTARLTPPGADRPVLGQGLVDAGKAGRVRGEVVEGDQAVGLAAPESGLELHHRVAALPGQAPGGGADQVAQPLGDEGALEEASRVAVLLGRLAFHHLAEVGGELGLGEAALPHVAVRNGHLPPRLQAGQRLAPGGLRPRPALHVPAFLVVDLSLEGPLQLRRFGRRLCRPEVLEHHLAVVKDPDGLVGAEPLRDAVTRTPRRSSPPTASRADARARVTAV